MPWLTLWFALQVGIAPTSGVVTYNPMVVNLYPVTGYIQMSTEIRMAGIFFIGGNVRTEIQAVSWHDFMPELSSYGFTAGLRYHGIEVGFLHECQHPTVPYYSALTPIINWDGAYEEFYVKLSGEATIW